MTEKRKTQTVAISISMILLIGVTLAHALDVAQAFLPISLAAAAGYEPMSDYTQHIPAMLTDIAPTTIVQIAGWWVLAFAINRYGEE